MPSCKNRRTCTRFERGVHCRPHIFQCFEEEESSYQGYPRNWQEEIDRLRAENAKLRDRAERDQRAIEKAYYVQECLRDRAERAEAENAKLLAVIGAANNLYNNWYAYNRQAFADAMFRALDNLERG